MTIRFANPDEYQEVQTHYEVCGYGGGLSDEDIVAIAIDGQIIAAVRICHENNLKILRGMQVKPDWQERGIGSSMLKFLDEHLDMNGCYCLPYKHLVNFYALIGFKEILPQNAPRFLAERLEKYLSSGNKEIIVMMINKR